MASTEVGLSECDPDVVSHECAAVRRRPAAKIYQPPGRRKSTDTSSSVWTEGDPGPDDRGSTESMANEKGRQPCADVGLVKTCSACGKPLKARKEASMCRRCERSGKRKEGEKATDLSKTTEEKSRKQKRKLSSPRRKKPAEETAAESATVEALPTSDDSKQSEEAHGSRAVEVTQAEFAAVSLSGTSDEETEANASPRFSLRTPDVESGKTDTSPERRHSISSQNSTQSLNERDETKDMTVTKEEEQEEEVIENAESVRVCSEHSSAEPLSNIRSDVSISEMQKDDSQEIHNTPSSSRKPKQSRPLLTGVYVPPGRRLSGEGQDQVNSPKSPVKKNSPHFEKSRKGKQAEDLDVAGELTTAVQVQLCLSGASFGGEDNDSHVTIGDGEEDSRPVAPELEPKDAEVLASDEPLSAASPSPAAKTKKSKKEKVKTKKLKEAKEKASKSGVKEKKLSKADAQEKTSKTSKSEAKERTGVLEKKPSAKKEKKKKSAADALKEDPGRHRPKEPVVDSWEALFDEDDIGAHHGPELRELTSSASLDVTSDDIMYASDDVTASSYNNDELNIVEVTCPAEFKMCDLAPVLNSILGQDNYRHKWVCDTSCLFSLNSDAAVKLLVESQLLGLLKACPIRQGTANAQEVARNHVDVLRPISARPVHTAMVARRMISSALNIRCAVSSDKRQEERQLLQAARAKKRHAAEMRNSVWDSDL